MIATDLIPAIRSGIAQILLERNRETVGNGSAFLIQDGLVTNSHVIRPPGNYDAVVIRFEDTNQSIRFTQRDLQQAILAESPESEKDYVFIGIDEPELDGRHRFEFGDLSDVSIGEQVLFLGFPFGMPQLTAHMGYISSIHEQQGKTIIQIDGSVNGGNSGGPLISLATGNVVGIITRAVTGIIEQEFNNLIATLCDNQRQLDHLAQSGMVINFGGLDPIQGFRSSQAAMEQIARNLKRSANVGIGYGFSTDDIRDQLRNAGSA